MRLETERLIITESIFLKNVDLKLNFQEYQGEERGIVENVWKA